MLTSWMPWKRRRRGLALHRASFQKEQAVSHHTHTHSHPHTLTPSLTHNTHTHTHTEYRLHAFVSHMGTSTLCGHYVCHIKKEGENIFHFFPIIFQASATPPCCFQGDGSSLTMKRLPSQQLRPLATPTCISTNESPTKTLLMHKNYY